MALQDFIQSLQDQDVVYSTPPKPSIRVIPPDNQNIKIIPPESVVLNTQTPKVIKLKIKQKPNVEEQPSQSSQQTQSSTVLQKPTLKPVSTPEVKQVETTPTMQQPSSNNTLKPVVQQSRQDNIQPAQKPEPVIQQSIPEEPKEITDDDIFNSTGTEFSKKAYWMEYYNKAKRSRKSNPIVDRMKLGRFTITPDNKVLLLPDYDIVGKDPDDVIKDKWF